MDRILIQTSLMCQKSTLKITKSEKNPTIQFQYSLISLILCSTLSQYHIKDQLNILTLFCNLPSFRNAKFIITGNYRSKKINCHTVNGKTHL